MPQVHIPDHLQGQPGGGAGGNPGAMGRFVPMGQMPSPAGRMVNPMGRSGGQRLPFQSPMVMDNRFRRAPQAPMAPYMVPMQQPYVPMQQPYVPMQQPYVPMSSPYILDGYQGYAQDADHFGFLESQVAHIETTPWKTLYAEIQYPRLVPVDRGAWEWAPSILRYVTDGHGKAQPMGQRGTDMPLVATTRDSLTQYIESFWVGYDYSIAELEQARRIPQVNLLGEKSQLANRVMDELIDDIVLNGRPEYGWDSLFKSSAVTAADAKNNAAGNSKLWVNKTGVEMANDINDAIDGIYVGSNTVLRADTVLLPPGAYTLASRTPINADQPLTTVLDWVKKHNSFTAETNQPLSVLQARELENAAAGNTGRLVAYRKMLDVLRLHIAMSYRLDSPYMLSAYQYVVPGMMRTAGLEIRQPAGIRYIDGITE